MYQAITSLALVSDSPLILLTHAAPCLPAPPSQTHRHAAHHHAAHPHSLTKTLTGASHAASLTSQPTAVRVRQSRCSAATAARISKVSLLKMLRQGPRFLLNRASAASMRWRRQLSTDLPAETAGDSKFIESWKKVMPNMDPPKTPSAYMAPRPPTPSTIPSKLTVNLVLPYDSLLSAKEVDMVIMPATTGQMGVLPGHVATIAELKPGVLSVHEGNDVTKYFLSGGFAFVHANSVADVIAIEAIPVDRIDLNMVQKGLAEFQQKLSSASTDVEKAEAQIGIDVHSALNAAVTG